MPAGGLARSFALYSELCGAGSLHGIRTRRAPVRRMGEIMGITKISYATKTWRPVPDWPGFIVSEGGDLMGPSGIPAKPSVSRDGHLYIVRRLGGSHCRMRKLWIHRAVLLAFRGPCPAGQECRHLDGDPNNNNLGNLQWGNRFEQRQDDRRNRVGRTRWKWKRVTDHEGMIFALWASGFSSRSIGNRFGLSHTTILHAVRFMQAEARSWA